MKLSLEKYIKRRLFDDADYVSDGRKKDTHVSMYIGWQALGPLKYGYMTGEEKYKLKDQSQKIILCVFVRLPMLRGACRLSLCHLPLSWIWLACCKVVKKQLTLF